MKKDIAVLADIHGNYVALDQCMKYCRKRGIETFIFLGDYLGELAYPLRTMERIYEIANRYECYFIRGNKEDYWLTYRENGESGWRDFNSTTGCLFYCYRQLTEREFAFYRELPISMELEIEGFPKLMLCHGSPERTNEKLLPGKDNTYRAMERCGSDIILCGHTHIQEKICHGKKVVLNAGSVGTPIESSAKCQFMILHGECGGWQEEFVDLEYDTERVIADLQEEKMDLHAPGWTKVTKYMLRQKKASDISHGKVLERAMELCEKNEGECIWPQIPEQYWEQAIRELLGESDVLQ